MPIEIKNLSIKIKVGNTHEGVKASSARDKNVSKNEVVAVVEEINQAKKER